MGLTPPMASRKATSRIAETLAAHEGDAAVQTSLPPPARLSPLLERAAVRRFPRSARRPLPRASTRWPRAASPATSCRSSIPPRRRLAYEGRMEFRSPEGSERWVADRVETLRPEYQRKLAAHRAEIEEAARRIGWSFLVHHTDRPAAEPLLTLIMRLQGMAGDYRWKPQSCSRGAGGAP